MSARRVRPEGPRYIASCAIAHFKESAELELQGDFIVADEIDVLTPEKMAVFARFRERMTNQIYGHWSRLCP
jgi:hypothetical protein